MADRTSAELFGTIFTLIDEHIKDPETRKSLALRYWKEQRVYDFSPYQMGCDDVLKRLGLARDGEDKYGPTMLYGPDGDQ